MDDVQPQPPIGSPERPQRVEAIALRPLALPLPLGYSALACGAVLLSVLHLGWIPLAETHTVGLLLVAFVAPLQAVAVIFSFPGRDTQSTTGLGLISLAWLVSGLVLMRIPPGTTDAALGVLELTVAVALIAPAVAAAKGRLAPAAVISLAALHFLVLGIYWVGGGTGAKYAAAAIGLLLAVVALYTVLGLQLEEAQGRAPLPLGRRGHGREAVEADLSSQLEGIEHSPGVRKRF